MAVEPIKGVQVLLCPQFLSRFFFTLHTFSINGILSFSHSFRVWLCGLYLAIVANAFSSFGFAVADVLHYD